MATLLCMVVAGAGAGSCFGRDGDTLERTQEYRSADGSFQLTYAAPPWELAKNGFSSARLEIGLEFFGIEIGGALPPSHIVLAAKVDPTASLEDLIGIDELKKIAEDNGFDLDDAGLPSEIPEDLETGTQGLPDEGVLETDTGESGGDETGTSLQDIVDYLEEIDVTNPRDVAIAEMGFLIDSQDAELISGLRKFQTASGHVGVEYQLFIPPGVHVRNYYMKTGDEALRVSFLSIFNLETADIGVMISSVRTNARPEAPPIVSEDQRDGKNSEGSGDGD